MKELKELTHAEMQKVLGGIRPAQLEAGEPGRKRNWFYANKFDELFGLKTYIVE